MFRFPNAKDFLFITNAAIIFEEGEDDGNISKWVCKFLEGLFVFGMRPTGVDGRLGTIIL